MPTLFWAIGVACAIYVIYNVWTKEPTLTDGKKILWTIAALIFNVFTAIVYYILRKR